MENESKVIIHIKSCQTDENGEKSEIEFYTEGKFGIMDEASYLVYEESEISGLGATKSTIKIKNGMLSLIRFGASTSKFVFDPAKITHTDYCTEYGCFEMNIETHEAFTDINDNMESKIYLRYTVDIENQGALLNELTLTFR